MSVVHWLTVIAPFLASVLTGLLVVVARRRVNFAEALWVLWAAIAGGQVALAALSAEFLSLGTGGVATAALGGMVAAALMAEMLRGRERHSSPGKGTVALEDSSNTTSRLAKVGRVALLSLTIIGAAMALTWADAGALALAILMLMSGVGAGAYGLSFAAGVFVASALASAGLVVVSKLVLSPAGLVGHELPTIFVVSALLTPFAIQVLDRTALQMAARRAGVVDIAAFAVAGVAGSAWWRILRGLSDEQALSQLVRLGEDHLSHLLMFEATQASGTTLGRSAQSVDVTSLFAGYFPGSSIWQTSVGALLSDGSNIRQYLVTTFILIGLLALGASAAATTVARRAGLLAAVGVLTVGAIAVRASLAMYELGFPGQLLVASWLVCALVLVTTRSAPRWLVIGGLALSVAAAHWTWSLVSPVLGLTLLIVLGQAALSRWPLLASRRSWMLSGSVLALVIVIAGLLLRNRVLATLDELTIEGGVFRGIPLWLSLILPLALPLAWRATGRPLPAAATTLVLSVGVGTIALMSWQIVRVGAITYYSYKLEYLLLALGWAIGTMSLAALTNRWEEHTPPMGRVAVGAAVLIAAAPLTTWPANNYRDWLSTRGVLGPSPTMSCAIHAAKQLPPGSLALGYGFGEPIVDYLTTRAMDVMTRNNFSAAFWQSLLYQPDPTAWPWSSTTRRLYLIEGPDATRIRTTSMVNAAQAAGARLTLAGSC